jgi:hypothetical protein
MSAPPHPARSLEQLVNPRRGHKVELTSSHGSILSIAETFLLQRMRARAELSFRYVGAVRIENDFDFHSIPLSFSKKSNIAQSASEMRT